MSLKALRIVFICISFTLLTGFFPILSVLGPGLTMVSSGNVVQAGTQIIFNHTIKQKTGKITHSKKLMLIPIKEMLICTLMVMHGQLR